MELKQIEYFLAVCKYGSLSKAAQELYTSPSNVSKVIRLLEEDLGSPLFERTTRGLRLTAYGKAVYSYASNMEKNAEMIRSIVPPDNEPHLNLAVFQSNVIAQLVVKLYQKIPALHIKYYQSNTEGIVESVEKGISDLGLLYISNKKKQAFQRLLHTKHLEYFELAKRCACVFCGPGSKLYGKTHVSLEEIREKHFVREMNDFFNNEDELQLGNIGIVDQSGSDVHIYTNSEHLTRNLLSQTDIAFIGIDLKDSIIQKLGYGYVKIEGSDEFLSLGYVKAIGTDLSEPESDLICEIKKLLNQVENI